MVKMTDLFGEDAEQLVLQQESLGNITLRAHEDDGDYLIANYTPKAAYEGAWNPVTLASRGLIFHSVTEEVLARPLSKFFNYGQAGAPEIRLDQEVRAANKYDGSLGIIYRAPDGKLAVATRGSFHSEQAKHATEVLRSPNYLGTYEDYAADLEDGYTPLVEIIYPENRIVLDYGTKDYLQPLGWVFNKYGGFIPAEAERLTFGELLARAPRPNAEGWVVWIDPFTAVKIKQEDYIALHKIVTNLNTKTVWEQVQKGPIEFRKFVADLPDELQPWADGVAFDMALQFGEIMRELDREYIELSQYLYATRDEVDEDEVEWDFLPQRKDFAIAVKNNMGIPPEHKSFMFSILDGKDYQGKVWKMIEPKGGGSRPSNVLTAED